MKVRPLQLFLAALILPAFASALFMRPELIPTDRMLKNIEAFLEKNPDDADAYYTKARIHYLTFSNKVWLVQGWIPPQEKEPPRVAADFLIAYGGSAVDQAVRAEAEKRAAEKFERESDPNVFYTEVNRVEKQLKKENWKPEILEPKEVLDQASKAAAAFDKAIKLDPGNGLYLLGKASLLEQVSDFLTKNDSLKPAADGPFANLKPEVIMTTYLRAYKASREKDLKLESRPASGLKSVTAHESATALVRLAELHPDAVGKVEGLNMEQVQKDLEKLKSLKQMVVTPMILSRETGKSLPDLIGDKPVKFDINGDGRKETIDSWPNAEAGLLVWDPEGTGEIHSGAQWFGTFGFQMLWRTGYQAMDAFDDSRDGWLTGEELRGMALWHDRNGNAISDPGEVRDVRSCGVKAIAVNPEAGAELQNRTGVRLRDGSATASYDWLFRVID
ncbi:MAG: hypothetical protein HKN23_18265 [Verrucomicrobiales bacterium]|nr:hypothetical protein [Verrucomicrobiales bacterium]